MSFSTSHRVFVGIWIVLIALGICLKLWLLGTSQSMPDSDEAVEGLMAIHILTNGEHPIYPYGVNYGAGAGWEAHLAALLFCITGPSEMSLKCVGLIHHLLTLGLVAAITTCLRGQAAGIVATGLFATAPQTAEWALKSAGGHQVSVILALIAYLLAQRNQTSAALFLLPLAALAHPIALPFAGVVCVALLFRDRTWKDRGLHLVQLLFYYAIEQWLLYPPRQTVWHPIAKSFDLAGRLLAVPHLALGLFSPNLNDSRFPTGWQLAVAIPWLAAVVVTALQRQQPRWNVLALLAPWGVLFLVARPELAPRHLLVVSPMAAIVIACGCASMSLWSRFVPIGLALLGLAIQAAETRNPCIHGPGLQSAGINRNNFSTIMQGLMSEDIHCVYCLDAMLQWNITFASRERVIARSIPMRDRVPEYVRIVDEARQRGERVAVVASIDQSLPPTYRIVLDPPVDAIVQYFQLTPGTNESGSRQ